MSFLWGQRRQEVCECLQNSHRDVRISGGGGGQSILKFQCSKNYANVGEGGCRLKRIKNWNQGGLRNGACAEVWWRRTERKPRKHFKHCRSSKKRSVTPRILPARFPATNVSSKNPHESWWTEPAARVREKIARVLSPGLLRWSLYENGGTHHFFSLVLIIFFSFLSGNCTRRRFL